MRHVKGLETLAFQLFEDSRFQIQKPYRFDFMFARLEEHLRTAKDFNVKSIHISMFVDDTTTAAEKELLAERLERSETSWRQAVA